MSYPGTENLTTEFFANTSYIFKTLGMSCSAKETDRLTLPNKSEVYRIISDSAYYHLHQLRYSTHNLLTTRTNPKMSFIQCYVIVMLFFPFFSLSISKLMIRV